MEPYTITIAEPNNFSSFYIRLYDSLDFYISKLHNNKLSNFQGGSADRQFVIGWLYDQFNTPVNGLGDRAGLKDEKQRMSDQFKLKKPGNISDNGSFSVTYLTDEIPNEYLSPDKWQRKVAEQNLYNGVAMEKEKFQKSPSVPMPW